MRRLRGRQRGHCIRRYESERGPLYICVRCSAYAHNRRERLRFECRGPRTREDRLRLNRVAKFRHPTRASNLWSLGQPGSVEQAVGRWANEDRPAEAACVAAANAARKRSEPDTAPPSAPPTKAARRREEMRQRIVAREADGAGSCASSPSQALGAEDAVSSHPALPARGPPRGEVRSVGEAASAATTRTLPLGAAEPPDALQMLLDAALAPIPEGDAGL